MNLRRNLFLPVLALLLAFAGAVPFVPDQALAGESRSANERVREQRYPDSPILQRRVPPEPSRNVQPDYGRSPEPPVQVDAPYQELNGRETQRTGRLTAEERRSLRREIDDVGREVYRSPEIERNRPPGRRQR